MAKKDELFAQVESAVRTVLNTAGGRIRMESMFRADLEAESIDFLDISYEIEQLTGIELDFPEVIQFIKDKKGVDEIVDFSIADLVDYLDYAIRNEIASGQKRGARS